MRSWSTGRRPTAACCIVVLCLCCVIAVAAEATPPGQSVPRVDGIATTVQHLRATLRAFEAMQAIPKPLPQSHHVEMWLGGVQYKSRMSPPWTDAATGRRVRFATGFGRRDVIVPVASSRSRGASATSWRARPFREYGFGDSQVVRVTPSGLDFGVQETCTPTLLSVQVSYRADALDAEHGHDASPSHDVQPLDIHGIAIHDKQFLLADVFHAVTLQPGDVHTFYVLFLPHEHSATIESTLTFQTSLGDVPYAVRGSGVPNRYRASKLAASIAAGVRYDPVVHLYNPHHQPLRVTEVFTTEGFLHLELPKTPPTSSTHPDDTRPTTGVWEIEAGATKPVMQLSFVSSVPGHYRAYVRVEMDKGHLILPVELTVLSEGLHLGATHLNFGVLVHDDEEHHIAVDFVNTGRTTVLVKGVSLQTPDSRISVVIQGSHAVGPLSRVKHAMVVSYGSIDPGTFTGMLIVHTNDTTVDPSTHGRGHGGDIWLNYTATKVSGRGLAFAPHEVEFTSCGGAGRGLVLTNYFDTAVAIEMVQLADPSLFSLHNFTGNAVAEAGTSWPPIYLDCIMDVDGNGTTTSPTLQWPVTTHTHSHLLVQTNVSRHVIPLVLSSNRLTVHTTSKRWHAMSTDAHVARRHRPLDKPVAAPSATGARRAFQLDLGNISSSRHVLVNLTNFNPRAIPVHSIVSHLATLEVSLEPMTPHFAASGMDCLTRHDAGNSDDAAADDACAIDRQQTPLYASDASSSCRSKHNMSTVIPPGYALPMVLHITPTATAATDVLALTISTTSETIDVYLTYTPVRGSIVPTRRKLRTACPLYPGRAEVVPLYVDSTFAFPVPITAIRVSDRRVQVLSQASAVTPNGTTLVAQLVVSPAYALGCANPDKFADCLLPVPIASRDWTPPSHGMLSSFGQAVTPADVAAHFQRLQRFAELETQGDTVAEMQVVMYTDLVAVAPVVVRMPMARPRLVGESTTHAGMVEMPLTHVGNVSEMWLTVTNPSNVTIDVALALLASKDSDEIGASGGFYTCPSPTKVVAACKDTWKAAVASGDDAVAMPAFFLSSMDKQTLAPGDTTTLGPILFAPSAAKEYVGRLYLRNTLSHIEPVVVRGQGGRGHVRVVNNAVLDSHAPPRVIALENDGNMPLVVHGWSCPNCGKCSGHDAGFCVQFPGSSTSDAVPVELAPGGSRLSLNVSFVSGCRFNREVEVVVLHTSSGNVSVPLEGAVASPYRECLGTTRMSYLHAGGRVIVWGLFALIVSQIVHYTVEIVWLDCHASPADTNFGYTPPVATEAPAFPDHVDDDALDDELQAIEAQVFESFTFAPIRSPAVQRVHDQRKAALAQKPTDKKKAKLKKALAATTRPDAVRTAHATRTCSPRNDVATVAAPVAPDESPSKNGPTASPRKERCNAEDAQLTPVSPHRAPPHTTRGAEHEQTTLSSTPSTTADGSDLQHDRGTAMKLKNALSSLPPAIATTTHVEHHPAELAHAVRASAHLPPARGASRQVPPVAQEFPQGVVHGPGSASHAACATYLVDQAKADHNEAADDAEDNGTSSVVTAACATVNDVAKICAAGNDTSTKCEERVVESDDGVRYTAGDNGSDTETGAVDGDCSAESKSSDEDGTDNGADDTDDGIHATDASKLDAEDAVDDGSGSDDPTWSADLDRVPLHVDSTSRDNTIVLDEIDQLMQEVHNEQQFRWHEPSLLSPGRGNATHWHDELPPHSALRHDQFAMPRRPHTSFPPRSIKSPVAAPPGFSAADADPLAVSRTYAHLGQLRRPPHDNVPPPMWDSQAFKAPLVLFGSSYFTGHQAGRIGSRRPCRSNPPAERPSQRHDFEPFHRNAFPGRERSLASLVDVDAPFESSRDVFLKSEMSPLQRDSRFGFW